ncbi:MAG: hypothetical protein KBD37_09520, partial [Burkholderiales bacterium]|nr:hypothetical protein [Burkholderiales bacterium]
MNLHDCFINDLSHCCKVTVKLPESFIGGKAYIVIDFNSATVYMSAYFQGDHDLEYYKKFIDYIVMNPPQYIDKTIKLPSAKLSAGRHIRMHNTAQISISSKYYIDHVEENTNSFTLSARIFIY